MNRQLIIPNSAICTPTIKDETSILSLSHKTPARSLIQLFQFIYYKCLSLSLFIKIESPSPMMSCEWTNPVYGCCWNGQEATGPNKQGCPRELNYLFRINSVLSCRQMNGSMFILFPSANMVANVIRIYELVYVPAPSPPLCPSPLPTSFSLNSSFYFLLAPSLYNSTPLFSSGLILVS